MYNNLEGFESLNEKEKELVLKILNEYSSKGSSKIYNKLLLEDYKEVPVDIITFIKDRQYLGNAWHTSSGKFKLYPYWEEKLKELFPDPFTTKYNNFIESGARGIGKAQPLDSTVFTESGYRKMEEISVGDKVFGEDGILHEVIGVFPQGIKNICEVSFSDGTTTLCCEDHLWTVNDIYFNTKNTYSCKQLIEKGLLLDNNNPRYKIPIVEPITFENADLSIDPFFMGLLLGHGNFYSTTLDELTIKKTFKFVGLTNVTDDMIEDIRLKLVSLNLFRVIYSELFIPKDYLYNSIDNRIKLLLGMLASINYSFENLDDDRIISTSSKLLYEDIAFIIQSLGGLVKKRVFTHVVEETVYFLDPLFPDIVYKKVGIDKKNKIERFITSINYKEQQECKCIYLNSKNHLYLTNDLIVTHNSEIAVILGLYLMHRLMCLKNPHEYLNLKPTEKVVFAFMNITMTLAEDIGVSKLQESVKISPWFMERGYLTGRDVKVWNPPDFIEILIGSQSGHLIGRPVFYCLDGDTIVLTDQGNKKIKDLEDKEIQVYSQDNNKNIILSDFCTVKCTGYFTEEYNIELDDGTTIKCTPNHKFLLKNGQYKEAQYLTIEDELEDVILN